MGREEMFRSVPMRNPEVSWEESKSGKVRIKVERKDFFSKLVKIFTGKPRFDIVPLDPYGSFIWKQMDGKKSVYKIQEILEDAYEGEIEDTRERTYKYFRSLKEYELIVIVSINQVKNEEIEF